MWTHCERRPQRRHQHSGQGTSHDRTGPRGRGFCAARGDPVGDLNDPRTRQAGSAPACAVRSPGAGLRIDCQLIDISPFDKLPPTPIQSSCSGILGGPRRSYTVQTAACPHAGAPSRRSVNRTAPAPPAHDAGLGWMGIGSGDRIEGAIRTRRQSPVAQACRLEPTGLPVRTDSSINRLKYWSCAPWARS